MSGIYCKLCGNTGGGTVAHLDDERGHEFLPWRGRADESAEAVLAAAGTSLRHYMPTTRMKVIDAMETILNKEET